MAQPKRPPNIVVILSDDQGYGDLDWHGNTGIETPNLRSLASQSLEFTRFSVSPVCAPTRAAFLTGRYPLRTGVHGVTGGRETLRRDETTLADILQPFGYRTGLIGKWHLGEQWPYTPLARGFDTFTGFLTGHHNRYFDSPVERNAGKGKLTGYITDALTASAMEFVSSSKKDPFFLYLAYNVPHSPFQVPEEDYRRHAAKGLPPDTASVHGMVENLDRNIGRLLRHLETNRQIDNTIIVFFSDNGPNTDRFNCGLRGRKGSVYEGGIRSPLLLKAPGLKAGKSDRICAHIDLLPTLLSLAGLRARTMEPLDGVDLSAPAQPRMLFVHADHQADPLQPTPGAVWDERYKLVNRTELYDLLSDPGERNNLAAAEPRRASEFRKAYDEWFAGVSEGFQPGAPPIEIGHPEQPEVELPATRAQLSGGLRYAEKFGYANDFAVGDSGTLAWPIDVVTPFEYRVTLEYLSEKGGTVEIGGEDAIQIPASPPDRLQPVPLPDRKPRSPEAPEMLWQEKSLGRVELYQGVPSFYLRVRGLTVKSVRLSPSGPVRRKP